MVQRRAATADDLSPLESLNEGLYCYCVAESQEETSLGAIGLGGSEVYTVVSGELCAVVHRCPAEPYRSQERGVVESWVLAHQRVVETAWKQWGTVLPTTFDTIFLAKAPGEVVESAVREWLVQEQERLKAALGRVRGKAEYGVQLFWAKAAGAAALAEAQPEIAALRAKMASTGPGTAFLYQEKLQKLLRQEVEAKAREQALVLHRRIRQYVAEVKVEETKRGEPGRPMILNLSCLANGEQALALGRTLEALQQEGSFTVRFTGPWPPYSFVGNP